MTEYASSAPRNRWQRLPALVLGLGLCSLLAAGVLLVLTLTGTVGKGHSQPETVVTFNESIESALTPLATPTIVHPTPDPSAIAALVIPKFGVNAPIQVKGIDGNNMMESPDGPVNVAWYDFTVAPGNIGNSVYSGHVDYINYGPAVFYNIRNLAPGDPIEIRLQSGTVYTYRVLDPPRNFSANPTEEELVSIIGPSDKEVITLITCGGTFSSATGEYDERTIVRAERVLQPATARAE